jgi:hypothetical protein
MGTLNRLNRGDSLRGYHKCAEMFATRRSGRDYKVLSHNQILYYDEYKDCYQHKHHSTITVEVYQHKVRVTTGGWNTSTTWAKIAQFCRIDARHKTRPHWTGGDFDKVVYYEDIDGTPRVAQYQDGMELDYEGRPLTPIPVHERRLIRGQTKEFYALVQQVKAILLPRALLGEFDEVDVEPLTGGKILNGMVNLVGRGERFSPHEDLCPFFAIRPQMSFGRARWRGRTEQPERTSLQRLQSNLNAARDAWLYQHSNELEYAYRPVESL